jgi:hypothetical protein
MNLATYGEAASKLFYAFYILKFDLNPKGFIFTKDEFVIYINVIGNKHEGILFKDKEILYRFEDNKLEGNKFIREIDKRRIFIDNLKISYFDKLINNTFITSSKTNVKLNSNIVTYDIETYEKDGKFIPFACG